MKMETSDWVRDRRLSWLWSVSFVAVAAGGLMTAWIPLAVAGFALAGILCVGNRAPLPPHALHADGAALSHRRRAPPGGPRVGRVGHRGRGRRNRACLRPRVARAPAISGSSSSALGTVAHAGTERLELVAIVRDGVDGVRGLHAPVAMTLSPGGEHVYVASTAENALAVFRREPTTGQLSFVEAYFDGVGGVEGLGGIAGPRPLSVSPDGRHLYVAADADRAVAVFRRDPTTGTLAFVETQVDGVGGVDGLAGAWAATVSPDGRHVYTAGFADRAVSVFARDATTGALSFLEAHVDGVGGIIGLHDP